jgi:hypothetical protein
MMVPVFEKTAFDQKVGQVSKPILSQFGWHIVKTTDKRNGQRGEEVRASHILIRIEPSPQSVNERLAKADTFIALAKTKGFDAAAARDSLQVTSSNEFDAKNPVITGLGRDEKLMKLAFTTPKGSLMDKYVTSTKDVLVAVVSDSMGEHIASLDTVRPQIENKLKSEKAVIVNSQIARDFYTKYGPDQYLKQAAADSISIVEATGIKLGQGIPRIGPVTELNEAILNTESGQYTKLIDVPGRGGYIAYVTKRNKVNETDWEKAKKKELAEAKERMEQAHLSQWYTKLQTTLSVVDKRDQFYPELKKLANAAPQGQTIEIK